MHAYRGHHITERCPRCPHCAAGAHARRSSRAETCGCAMVGIPIRGACCQNFQTVAEFAADTASIAQTSWSHGIMPPDTFSLCQLKAGLPRVIQFSGSVPVSFFPPPQTGEG